MSVPTEPGYYWARKDGDLPDDARVVLVGYCDGELTAWEPGEPEGEELHVYFEWSEKIPNALSMEGIR